MISSDPLDVSLRQYQDAVEAFAQTPTEETLLRMLLARDRVQELLFAKPDYHVSSILLVIELDKRLRKHLKHTPVINYLAEYRNSFDRPAILWWWHLDQQFAHSRWKGYDWLWPASALLIFAIALSIAVDISQRFLAGGLDATSVFAVLGQSILGLLAIGGILTKIGQQLLDEVLSPLPSILREKARFVLAFLFLIIVLLFYFSLPYIAVNYNNSGRVHHRAGALLSAQRAYQQAIHLYPDYAIAHYNLGLLHEDLLDYQAALTEYQFAVMGGLDVAFNNAARLYILEDKPDQAVNLLLTGLNLVEDVSVKHDMYKNLGWARLEQGALADARMALEQAIELNDMAAANYCLLAQTLIGLQDQAGAADAWYRCIALADNTVPEEDAWRIQGQEWFRQSFGE